MLLQKKKKKKKKKKVKFTSSQKHTYIILLKNINCGYSIEPPRRGGSNEYLKSMISADI